MVETVEGVWVGWFGGGGEVEVVRWVPGSATAVAMAVRGEVLWLLQGGGRVERWGLEGEGFGEPEVVEVGEIPAKRALCAWLHVRGGGGVRLRWMDAERALWGALRGLVQRGLPLEIEGARVAGVLEDRVYVLVQQRATASHGPWLWMGFDMARPDLPLWVAPALRARLMPLAASVCERYGLLIATREGLWWFDRKGKRRDLIQWPEPEAGAKAERVEMVVSADRRDLYVSVDGKLWRWSMRALRGRTLPTLRAQEIPEGGEPVAAGPGGLVGWRRRDAAPCWSRPGYALSRMVGLLDVGCDAGGVWELFERGWLRWTPYTREESGGREYLVVPPPERVVAGAGGEIVVAGQGYVTWVGMEGEVPVAEQGEESGGSLRYEGLASGLKMHRGEFGWLVSDARRIQEVWMGERAQGRRAFLGLRRPKVEGEVVHVGVGVMVVLADRKLWRLDAQHRELIPFAELPPDTLKASLRLDGKVLVLQDANGLVLWPDLDPASAVRLLLMPAEVVGWIGENLLISYHSEGWRVDLSAAYTAAKNKQAPHQQPQKTAEPTGIPLSPSHHAVIDQTDLSPPLRAALQGLCAEVSQRWPDQPSAGIGGALRRAAFSLVALDRLRQLRMAAPDGSLDMSSEAQAMAALHQMADAALSVDDLRLIGPLLEPHTLERLVRTLGVKGEDKPSAEATPRLSVDPGL